MHLNTLMPKDYFGEVRTAALSCHPPWSHNPSTACAALALSCVQIALLQKTVRTATLTAVMACTLLYLRCLADSQRLACYCWC